jgi:N-acetylmuramoyl-L-alanine amidase
MGIDISTINSEANRLSKTGQVTNLEQKTGAAKAASDLKNKGVLGSPGQSINGIKALSGGNDAGTGDPVKAAYDLYSRYLDMEEDIMYDMGKNSPEYLAARAQTEPYKNEYYRLKALQDAGKIAPSPPSSVPAEDSIVEVTGNVPGLTEDLQGTVPAAEETDLNKIIGADDGAQAQNAAIKGGQLKKTISSGSPQAIAKALTEATGKAATQFKQALAGIAPPGSESAIDTVDVANTQGIASASELAKATKNILDDFKSAVDDVVGDLFGNLTIKNDTSFGDTFRRLINFNDPQISKNLSINELFRDLSNNKQEDIVAKISSFGGLNADDIEGTILGLSMNPNRVIESEKVPAVGEKTIPCYIIGSNDNTWDGANTPTVAPAVPVDSPVPGGMTYLQAYDKVLDAVTKKALLTPGSNAWLAVNEEENKWRAEYERLRELAMKEGEPKPTVAPKSSTPPTRSVATQNSQFTFVNSREELDAEFASCTRDITEVVVHWTGTYNNQDIGAEDVHQWHKEKGWSGIGYHFIIRRDGRLQRGRPLNKTGAHAGANGHNKYSIGVSFAAGYNCPSGTKNANKFISADSITAEQMKTFDMFMGSFYDEFPGGQAFGHVDTDDKGKQDPGFDVQEYVLSKFGKKNVIADGQQPPLSPTQLAQSRPATILAATSQKTTS